MIFVRARNAAENLVLLEDDSRSPHAWIVMCNGRIFSVTSEATAKAEFTWLEWFPRIEENALAEEKAEELLEQVTAWLKVYERDQKGFIPQPKPKPEPAPEVDFGM